MGATQRAMTAIVDALAADAAFAGVSFPATAGATSMQQHDPWPALEIYAESAWRPDTAYGSGGVGIRQHIATIRLLLHVPYAEATDALTTLYSLYDEVPRVLFAAFGRTRLGGAVTTLGDPETRGGVTPLTVERVASEWGGIQTLALRYALTVGLYQGDDTA